MVLARTELTSSLEEVVSGSQGQGVVNQIRSEGGEATFIVSNGSNEDSFNKAIPQIEDLDIDAH
jgi:hypothetical protein